MSLLQLRPPSVALERNEAFLLRHVFLKNLTFYKITQWRLQGLWGKIGLRADYSKSMWLCNWSLRDAIIGTLGGKLDGQSRQPTRPRSCFGENLKCTETIESKLWLKVLWASETAVKVSMTVGGKWNLGGARPGCVSLGQEPQAQVFI